VRRSGDGSSSYEFGYVYTIDLDAEGTSLLGSAYSPLHLACVGASACGCADVLGAVQHAHAHESLLSLCVYGQSKVVLRLDQSTAARLTGTTCSTSPRIIT
jgi:hypothetical protein